MKFLRHTALALAACCLTACAADDPYEQGALPKRHFSDPQQREWAEQQFAVHDPLEGMNKGVYKFNAQLDRYVLLPIVDAYTYVTPEFLRTRVSRFFENVGEFKNFTNAVLQGSPEKAGTTLGRFAVNTTVGLLGTFDVATDWGMARQPEDFGQTLGVWGAGPGPYLVLPFFGPSNLRDTAGLAVDYLTFSWAVPDDVEDDTAYRVAFWGVQPLNARYVNKFRYFESGTPFEYEFVRYGKTRMREMEVQK